MVVPRRRLGPRCQRACPQCVLGQMLTGLQTFLMLMGSDPFEHQNTAPSSRAGQLACIHALLGPFPAHFLQRCARAGQYFDADGERLFAMS